MSVNESVATWRALVEAIDEALQGLDPATRLDRLFGLISPLLDEVAAEVEESDDEPGMTISEAVAGARGIAVGESLNADSIHFHLTCFALSQSEDQDVKMRVRAQAAWLTAAWLQLKAGRRLRTVDDIDDYGLDGIADIVNMLAWTRSGQVVAHPDSVNDDYAEYDIDLPATLDQLRAMRDELG